ncbi:2354_t:CDS:2 [Cetraspora pellucida]|uniref:Endoglucanase n=1 Tax=Cetraspora pellucida TaxID=1433469 RepID=A0A9N9CAC0_9GLOM|nr:2354_t:CDS:2 [Cetraspora pellucida]
MFELTGFLAFPIYSNIHTIDNSTSYSFKDTNMVQFRLMLKNRFSLLFLTFVIICITYIVSAFEAKPSLGLIPSPDIPGIPKEGNDYSKLLAYSLYFYEAQRSGILPKNNRVSWRHNSALDDGKDRGVNLTGGYYDAGDYLKFTLPLSWSLSLISWGAIEWFEGYQLSNQTEYLREMVKWGTDWLISAHPKPNQLFIQVGSPKIDNNYWGPDTNIPKPRPAYDINSTAHGTEVAAEAAAAFASSAILFQDFFNDTSYAKTLISHAISVYAYAESQKLTLSSSTVIKEARGYYTPKFFDKLAYGAIWLYRATYQSQYLDKAVNYYNQYKKISHDIEIMTWGDQIGSCNILFAQIFDKSNANFSFWSSEAEHYLDNILTNTSVCNFTSGGLLWCDDSITSIPTSLNSAFGFLMYSAYASTIEKANIYRNFVYSQINYIFGDNPMKMFYIVAVHPNSPKNPHHAGAHGGTNVENLNDPPETKYPLYGAVIGGPSMNDSYLDSRSNYIQSEVALDYNSAFQGIMAYYVMNIINTYNIPNPPSPYEPINPVLSTFQHQKIVIIGVICSVFFLFLVLSIIVYKYIRNNQKGSSNLEGNNRKDPSDLKRNSLERTK